MPAAEFLLGGYSWVKKRFELWRIHYQASEKTYVADPALWVYFSAGDKRIQLRVKKKRPPAYLGQIAFAGDQAELGRTLVRDRLTDDYLTGRAIDRIDMQPFEVLREMLRNPKRSHTIGGAPQIVKVYQYSQAVSFAVYWPNKQSGKRFLQGRPCLGYENLDTKIFDPDRPAWDEIGEARRIAVFGRCARIGNFLLLRQVYVALANQRLGSQ
jgi:hypothetical protein